MTAKTYRVLYSHSPRLWKDDSPTSYESWRYLDSHEVVLGLHQDNVNGLTKVLTAKGEMGFVYHEDLLELP